MEDNEDKPQKIQMIAFTTNEKDYHPNTIISNYLNNNSHFIIKKNQQIIAFSTVLPEQKKTTKIMICSLIDLDVQYEGINNVNCYIVIIDLQKESSKEKLDNIIQFIQNSCETTKKIFILGVKKEDDDEEQNEIKVTKKEIEEKLDDLNLDYEYYELNADNAIEISDKIIEMFKFCFTKTIDENDIKDENDGRSCFIY
jgi:hypothetical protein